MGGSFIVIVICIHAGSVSLASQLLSSPSDVLVNVDLITVLYVFIRCGTNEKMGACQNCRTVCIYFCCGD